MNIPFIVKLNKADLKNIEISTKDNLILSSIMPYPLISLGFHSFVKRTREAMNITKNLESKTEFYYVVNPFETSISNYEEDIQKSSKTYFKNKEDLDNEFFQIWESLFVLNIANKKELSALISSKKPDDIVSAVKLYREKSGKSNKKDSIKSTKEKRTKKGKIDLMISSDINENENESYKSLIENIIEILKNQDTNGNALLKVGDTYTLTTIKLIYILSAFYNETMIYKPFLSRPTISEKYIVLKGFKSSKEVENVISGLESILEKSKSDKYIIEIFPDLIIPKEIINTFRFVNTKLINNQQIMINDIVVYIKENNYFGDKYHNYRDIQINTTKWWLNNFFSLKNVEELEKLYKTTQEKLDMENQITNV
jgi:hypothetical protein